MNVFISWSGTGKLSEGAAEAIRNWLPLVLQSVQPWMSARDVYAGSRWSTELAKQLAGSNFGILCVTRESMNKPWLLFEAGSLAKSLDEGCVIPLLVDLEPAELSGPLTQFQCQKLDKRGMWSVIDSVNHKLVTPVPNDRLRKAFEVFWPELESARERLLLADDAKGDGIDRASTANDTSVASDALEQILSRLTALEHLLSSQRSAAEVKGIRVTTSGAGPKEEVNVTWFKDLLLVVENFQSELGIREYQLELRRSTDSPTYKQVQDEMEFASEVHALITQRLAKARNP